MASAMRKRNPLRGAASDSSGAGLQLSQHPHWDGPEMFEHVCKLGCEGIVSRASAMRKRNPLRGAASDSSGAGIVDETDELAFADLDGHRPQVFAVKLQ
jgi:hypothetical protein